MSEESVHVEMGIEWLRRNSGDFDRKLRTFLFKEGEISDEHEGDKPARPATPAAARFHGGAAAGGGLSGPAGAAPGVGLVALVAHRHEGIFLDAVVQVAVDRKSVV